MSAVVDLLRRAAADGHTYLPAGLLRLPAGEARPLGGPGVSQGPADGLPHAVAVPVDDGAGWALADLAEAEELLADGVAALVAEGRLACVLGPAGAGRAAAVRRLTEEAEATGASVTVGDAAERLGLVEAVALVEDLPEDALLLLAGDLDLPWGAGPGAVLHDVVSASGCPVVPAAGVRDRPAALARIEDGARVGALPAPDPEDRTVVVVPVEDDDGAARRAVQLVSVSIPRAFDIRAHDIGVLTLSTGGPAGTVALAQRLSADLGDASPETVVLGTTASTWPAVVVVLPGSAAGSLRRDVVLAGLAAGQRHVSVVHGCGADLARAVARVPHRPRRTRLARLLRDITG